MIDFIPLTTGSPGIVAFSKERDRQIEVEGWSFDNDDKHENGELAIASACYMNAAACQMNGQAWPPNTPPRDWPWDPSWWKPSKFPARNVEKGGALAAAEYDRMSRLREKIAKKEKGGA